MSIYLSVAFVAFYISLYEFLLAVDITSYYIVHFIRI